LLKLKYLGNEATCSLFSNPPRGAECFRAFKMSSGLVAQALFTADVVLETSGRISMTKKLGTVSVWLAVSSLATRVQMKGGWFLIYPLKGTAREILRGINKNQ
jgi:hypothetical protein